MSRYEWLPVPRKSERTGNPAYNRLGGIRSRFPGSQVLWHPADREIGGYEK